MLRGEDWLNMSEEMAARRELPRYNGITENGRYMVGHHRPVSKLCQLGWKRLQLTKNS